MTTKMLGLHLFFEKTNSFFYFQFNSFVIKKLFKWAFQSEKIWHICHSEGWIYILADTWKIWYSQIYLATWQPFICGICFKKMFLILCKIKTNISKGPTIQNDALLKCKQKRPFFIISFFFFFKYRTSYYFAGW